MNLSAARIKALWGASGLGLGELLEKARVSRTAYYSLVRRRTVLPRSVLRLADALHVPPSKILEAEPKAARRARDLLAELDGIMKRHPRADREDVWHTLLLLESEPIDRLRRALLRGRRSDLH